MTQVIAVAGKGGTGKTTICGMLTRYLADRGKGPIFAVDADPNANLNEVLGVEVDVTLGDIREDIAHSDLADKSPIPVGMSKQEYAEFRMNSAIVENDDYDLIVMGRTQGKGCYCFVNGLLQTQIEKYSGAYRYMVVDNEAGMEHISRGILPHIDVLLLISDCSRRGIQAVARIRDMVNELNLNPSVMKLLVNRAPDGKLDKDIQSEIERLGLDLLAVIPQDQTIYEYDCAGKPTAYVSTDAPVSKALSNAFSNLDL